jgi:hypothetical protein
VSGERWNEAFNMETKKWCHRVAGLAADALVDAGVVARDSLEGAAEVVSEEIYARLSVRDYPPSAEAGRS